MCKYMLIAVPRPQEVCLHSIALLTNITRQVQNIGGASLSECVCKELRHIHENIKVQCARQNLYAFHDLPLHLVSAAFCHTHLHLASSVSSGMYHSQLGTRLGEVSYRYQLPLPSVPANNNLALLPSSIHRHETVYVIILFTLHAPP